MNLLTSTHPGSKPASVQTRELEAEWKEKVRIELSPAVIESMADDPPVAFSPGGDLIAVGAGKDIRIWNSANGVIGTEQLRLQGHTAAIAELEWNSKGSVLKSRAEQGDPFGIRLWSVQGRCLAKLDIPDANGSVFSPDGNHFAWIDYAGTDHSRLVLHISDMSFQKPTSVELDKDCCTDSERHRVAWLTYSPDGKTMAAILPAAKGNPLRILNAATGRTVAALPFRDFDYYDVPLAFSQDGKYVVWALDKQHLGLFDTTSQHHVVTADDPRCVPRSHFVINHAGTEVASDGDSAAICIWNTTTGALKRVLAKSAVLKSKHRAEVTFRFARTWTPDDRGLLVSEGWQLVLRDGKTGRRVPFPKVNGAEAIPRADIPTPQGLAKPDGTLVLVSRDATLAWFLGPQLSVRVLEISAWPNTNREVTAISDDVTAVLTNGLPTQVLSLDTGDSLGVLEEPPGAPFNGIAFHPSAPSIVGVGPTGPSAWHIEDGPSAPVGVPVPKQVHYLEFGQDNHSLIVATGDALRVWDFASGDPGVPMISNSTSAERPDQNVMVPTGAGASIQIDRWRRWHFKASGQPEQAPLCESITAASQAIRRAAQAPVLAVAQPEHVLLCDLTSGKLRRKLEDRTKGVQYLAIGPHGRHLALAASGTGTPFVLNLDNDQRVELTGAKAVGALEFLSEQRVVAAERWAARVHVWDSSSGSEQVTFDAAGDKARIAALTASDDGRYIAVVADKPEVSIWTARGERYATQAMPDWPTAMAFSKNGHLLAIGAAGLVTLYDVQHKAPVVYLGQSHTPDGAFVFSPKRGFQVFGDSAAADANLRCHVGPVQLPLEACRDLRTDDNFLCSMMQ